MFTNLKNVLAAKRITLKQYAEILGIAEKTVWSRLKGDTDFTYLEFKKTCTLLHEYNADYLFAIDNEQDRPA